MNASKNVPDSLRRQLETRVPPTGGDWQITEDGKYPIIIFSTKPTWKGQPMTLLAMMPCTEMMKGGPLGFGESIANARLMAAGPSMLAALKRAADRFDFTVSALSQGHTVSISSLQNCAADLRAEVAKAILP
jgi:hypothetical protein